MHKKFIATVIAAALTVTSIGAAPARADNADLLRALAAIAGVVVVGKVIQDRNERRNEYTYKPVTRQTYIAPVQRHNGPIYTVKPRPLPKRVNRNLLPSECLRSVRSQNGIYRFFGKNCLKQNYGHFGSLPRECKVKFTAHNSKKREGFGVRCLNRQGYKLARS